MEILQLRYFVEAARLNNFSRVAEKYFVPQSSISATIAKLENELGTKLFNRNGKKISLNEKGQIFYNSINEALNNIDEGIKKLAAYSKNNLILLVLASSNLAHKMLADFYHAYPNSEIKIFHNVNDYEMPTFTICSSFDPFKNNGILLMEEEIVAAVSIKNELSKKESIKLSELKKENIIGFSNNRSLKAVCDAIWHDYGIVPNIVIETDDSNSFRAFINDNVGIGLTPKKVWNLNQISTVKLLPINDMICSRKIFITYEKNYKLSEYEKTFINFAKEWYSKK